MTKPTNWTPELLARVTLLNKSKPLQEISRDVGLNRETIRTKLIAMEVPLFCSIKKPLVTERKLAKPKDWMMAGVWFEDHPAGDSDRFKGRKPLAQSSSNMGCAADMCVNGAF